LLIGLDTFNVCVAFHIAHTEDFEFLPWLDLLFTILAEVSILNPAQASRGRILGPEFATGELIAGAMAVDTVIEINRLGFGSHLNPQKLTMPTNNQGQHL